MRTLFGFVSYWHVIEPTKVESYPTLEVFLWVLLLILQAQVIE